MGQKDPNCKNEKKLNPSYKPTGRKPGSWNASPGESILNYYHDEILARVQARESNVKIAEDYGTSLTNLHRWLRQHTNIYDTYVECILVECNEVFKYNPRQKACCRQHIKRYNARGGPGRFVECALPECGEKVIEGSRRSYCCRAHSERHSGRVKKGWYENLLLRPRKCIVCDESLVLDQHHIEHSGGKSNKEGPVVDICPTHHLAIHRGYARFEDGEYVWMEDRIVSGLAQKHPDLLLELGPDGSLDLD